MGPSPQTDAELETQARAQAAAILTALMRRHAAPAPMATLFSKVGLARPPPAPPPEEAVPAPGRELLLWRLRREVDVGRALTRSFVLFAHPDFLATMPPERPCPIAVYAARRKWMDAAQEWAALKSNQATTWLRCDRKLLLLRRNQEIFYVVVRNDLEVRFHPAGKKLTPSRVETQAAVPMAQVATIVQMFPTLTVKTLVDGLRAPTQGLGSGGHRAAADAYIAQAPVFAAHSEAFLQQKRRVHKDSPEDPNKGFVAWLSQTLRASSGK